MQLRSGQASWLEKKQLEIELEEIKCAMIYEGF
jgi:hypothetical protein